jgi:8-oxo-dGTP pyrophosphatase MutT (NUDIX family)
LTINNPYPLQSQLIPSSDLVFPEEPHNYAAVLVPLVYIKQEWHLLLTLRAAHLTYHSGEVAFPGGMWESKDQTPVHTALRESEEEIALTPSDVVVLGGLHEQRTRRLTRVRPIVGVFPTSLPLMANKAEIAEIFTVPINFFIQDQRLRTDIFMREHTGEFSKHWVPAYQFDKYEIWGFTAAVIVQLLNRCFDTILVRDNNAPEKIW